MFASFIRFKSSAFNRDIRKQTRGLVDRNHGRTEDVSKREWRGLCPTGGSAEDNGGVVTWCVLPSALGGERRAATKVSSRSRRTCAGRANSERGTAARRHTPTGRGSQRHHAEVRVGGRPRCGSGCFYSPNKSNVCFRGATCLCLV